MASLRSRTPLKDNVAMKKPSAFILGTLAILLIALGWFFGTSDANDFPFGEKKEATGHVRGSSSENEAVVVADQPAGSGVLVDEVRIAPPGVWIAVHETVGERLGNILGAARTHGPASGVTVPLLRATLPGRTYAVVLYRDNGDGAFDHTTDSVYVDFERGERVAATFVTLP